MNHFTFRQLEYLIACIDHSSIARAAEALHVSQPTISTAIAKLEDRLGVQLLMRVPKKGVIATTHANTIVHSARLLLADATALAHQANDMRAQVSGEIRLGCFSTFAPLVLPKLLDEFSRAYPEVRFRLFEGTQDALLEQLSANQLDFALLYDIGLSDQMISIKLASRQPHVVLPQHHALVKKTRVSLQQLVELPMILLDVSPSQKYFLDLFRQHALSPNIAHSSPSLELVRGMVGQGLGYSILVTRPDNDYSYAGKKLVIRPLKETAPDSSIALVRPASVRKTLLISRFTEAAIASFAAPTTPHKADQ